MIMRAFVILVLILYTVAAETLRYASSKNYRRHESLRGKFKSQAIEVVWLFEVVALQARMRNSPKLINYDNAGIKFTLMGPMSYCAGCGQGQVRPSHLV